MKNNLVKIPLRIRLINLYALIFILFGSIMIGSAVFLKTLEFLLHKPIANAAELFKAIDTSPKAKEYLLLSQGLTSLVSFIVIPLIVIFFVWPYLKGIFKAGDPTFGQYILLAVLTTLVSIPLIALLSDVNKSLLTFPDSWKGIETWMKSSELEAEKLTRLLAYYNNPLEFWGGLLVIAVLPALGEELLFRGVIQNQLIRIFNNPHLAILLTGFLFSFIHFQFYGFLPRMFLGVMFGYLFYWSGSLWVPVAMHFTQNALTYIALNFYQQKKLPVDLESSKDLNPLSFVISGLLFLFLLYRFYKIKQEPEALPVNNLEL